MDKTKKLQEYNKDFPSLIQTEEIDTPIHIPNRNKIMNRFKSNKNYQQGHVVVNIENNFNKKREKIQLSPAFE